MPDATMNPGPAHSYTAGANVTAFRFVTEAAGGIVDRGGAGAVGELCKGVATKTAAAGNAVGVVKEGTMIVEAGAVVADLAQVMTDAVGRAITYAAQGGTTRYILGYVTNGSSAGAAGDFLSVHLYDAPIMIVTP